MEENKNYELENNTQQEEKSSFDFQALFSTLILNWKWFLLSLLVCVAVAFVYLRYATPVYQAYAKLLIKDDESNNTSRGRNSLMYATNLGIMSNSTGIDNEMEILKSHSLAEQTVKDLRLYVSYTTQGKIKDQIIYKTQPIDVDLDSVHLNELKAPVMLTITREGSAYHLTGKIYNVYGSYRTLDKTITSFPALIGTSVGYLTLLSRGNKTMKSGEVLKVTITPPTFVASRYVASLGVSQTSKTTTIAQLVLQDQVPQRAIDYLRQLSVCYNRQANEDKNLIALRTEAFINSRLEKINEQLGSTEGQLESYKKRKNVVELNLNAGQALQNQDTYSQKLADANTQVALLNELDSYLNQSSNKYQPLPANVGLTDQGTVALISEYNKIASERNRLLHSASESSPSVTPLTAQLDELSASIHGAMNQAKKSMQIQRNSVAAQYGKYSGQISDTPEQERMLTQIGRQQEVKSGLYLMLLQKREENSISLAATADKGKLIDDPQYAGKVSPKSKLILLFALLLGLAIPAGILFIRQFFRYKIEGHDDVVRLTNLPIIADVAVASETAKTKADIVVHENQNNQMEEIFRSMRTNLQFMLKDNQKTVMFTSSTSGEGKTFNAANLAVSFALLNKKVIIVGLDIRKPRLAELFEIDDHHHGITVLLTMENPTEKDVKSQIIPSGINNNLDLLLAGPIPPNPTELLARESLEKVMDIVKANYDFVIIDTAPVGLVTDTLQIGRVADATIYTCRADYTPKESFELINSLAAENKLPNMCVILNGIDMSKKKYSYYYGYGRYGKYGRYGRYGRYGSYGKYGKGYYGNYGTYGSYGNYSKSNYGDKNDTSVKR